MNTFKLVLSVLIIGLMPGCITFDQKSESVTFHQLSGPIATPTQKGPILYIPRSDYPS
jgi:hypothetical protein